MKIKFQILVEAGVTRLKLDKSQSLLASSPAQIVASRPFSIANGFTLIEVMVSMVLLSLIVFALMAVFSNTQKAFRSGITQTDVLESGRAVMDMMAADLRTMSPSGGAYAAAVNFCVTNYTGYPMLNQSLVAVSSSTIQRTNILENFFILSRGNVGGNDSWIGTGYAVVTDSADGIYSLYRFTGRYPVITTPNPAFLFTNFLAFLQSPTNAVFGYSHLLDGVLDLRVRAFDANGAWIGSNFNTNNVRTSQMKFYSDSVNPIPNEFNCFFYSNTLPMAVEIQMATLEDHVLQHAESLPPADQAGYLAQQAGAVHVFRQRVMIPNADPAAYQ